MAQKYPLPIIVWDNGIQFFLSSDFKKVEVKEITAPDSSITFEPIGANDICSQRKHRLPL